MCVVHHCKFWFCRKHNSHPFNKFGYLCVVHCFTLQQKLGMLENTTATLSKNLSAISHPTMPAVQGPTTGDLKAQVDELLQEMVRKVSS